MRKTLKMLLAAACVLLAVAVALLIYLEFGRKDTPKPDQPETVPTSTAAEETTSPEDTTAPTETEFVPETQEGGMPVFPFDQEDDPDPVATEGDPSATEGTYVPDEDELPPMPL